MLKALELVGFKSFADRTRFDFPDGITVVVGPNGSGKSNVVDAVKWVLGAQSAKALRGADMADVIFKGSAEGGRKPANSAEVVLILDNSTRIFSHDADEVQVSRRVFRSGEGEYAINGQPCRLKDVKDLFRGTGVGVDAYSLIEQGKVDRLLQASAKDRRGIFEEAAGISRFKAKKVEAERRLVRVDQNMLRLNDIVDEIGKRLATLKSQAVKANRYRELTIKLKSKRQQLGWIDRTALQKDRQRLEKQLAEAMLVERELNENLASLQVTVATEQTKWQELQSAQEALQAEYINAQRTLISAENGYTTAMERSAELTAEQRLLQERIAMLQQRATLSSDEVIQKESELTAIESERLSAFQQLSDSEAISAQYQVQLAAIKFNVEQAKKKQQALRENVSENRSKWTAYQLHTQQIQQSIVEQQRILAQANAEMSQIDVELQTATMKRQSAQQAAELATAAKREAEDRVQRHRLALMSAQEHLIALQGKSQGVRERLLILEQLEDQFTGAGRGGQQLLRLARENQNKDFDVSHPTDSIVANIWGTVLGLVADQLTTEMHLAPLIDVALGTHADAIVLSNGQIIDWINEGNFAIDGRVTLLRMDRLTSRRSGEKIQLDGLRGVLGRADRMTQFDPAYEPLIRFLLGTTWFVDTLSTALELNHFRGAGLRFVTAECQLVESDGSITLGSLQTGLGLVSRRSEMQSAREEIKHVDTNVSKGVLAVGNAQTAIIESEAWLQRKDVEAHEATRELTTNEIRLEAIQDRQRKLISSLTTHEQNVLTAEGRLGEVQQQTEHAEIAVARLSKLSEEADEELVAITGTCSDCERSMQTEQSVTTERRIQLARIEQRLVGLRTTMEQMQQDSAERMKNVMQAEASLETIAARIASNSTAVTEFQDRSTEAQSVIQNIDSKRSESALQIQAQNLVLQNAIRNYDSANRSVEKGQDRIQALQEQKTQFAIQWDGLHDHYAQEYQVDLHAIADRADRFIEHRNAANLIKPSDTAAIEIEESDPEIGWLRELLTLAVDEKNSSEFDRVAIESEIIHLRQEIAASGGVNMEALAELDVLQLRFDRMSNHYQDLSEAKATLTRTMAKIDEDSQELFITTLSTIRKNFQDLYRRSFGGGFADIVLEDERDPDSGIEIVATPPGKTTLSNTLLSGGEKALTAVALIMAFFQYRPSPFCILDEVDAPFDEANIGRFVTVLREFLDTTKFIVVTHSKKTMTAANMIYGITMQESGVSRQVSVRFEEVGDQGEILSKRAA